MHKYHVDFLVVQPLGHMLVYGLVQNDFWWGFNYIWS